MISSVKGYFHSNCFRGKHVYGDLVDVDKSFIKSIESSICIIDKKEYSGHLNLNRLKSENSFQYLRRGLLNWNNSNEKNEKTNSLIGNIENDKDSINSVVNLLDDKLNNLGSNIESSLKSLDKIKGNIESKEYSLMKLKYFQLITFEVKFPKISPYITHQN